MAAALTDARRTAELIARRLDALTPLLATLERLDPEGRVLSRTQSQLELIDDRLSRLDRELVAKQQTERPMVLVRCSPGSSPAAVQAIYEKGVRP